MAFLHVEAVAKSYGPIEVLSAASLSLEKGATAAILGESGSGKTTLLSIVGGIEPPDTGRVLLDGTDLWSLSQSELAAFRGARLGVIFQDFHLVPSLTAEENVSLPLEIQGRPDSGRVRELLRRVGLENRHNHYPHQLSGGEQQRVAIARALAPHPALLLADEPTGSLDEKTSGEVEALIFELIAEHGITTLMITHSPGLASRCGQIHRLKTGRLQPAESTAAQGA